jgi:hypothetical protein
VYGWEGVLQVQLIEEELQRLDGGNQTLAANKRGNVVSFRQKSKPTRAVQRLLCTAASVLLSMD